MAKLLHGSLLAALLLAAPAWAEPWRDKVTAFVDANLHHPAWGASHSRRDYALARSLARKSPYPAASPAAWATRGRSGVRARPVMSVRRSMAHLCHGAPYRRNGPSGYFMHTHRVRSFPLIVIATLSCGPI